MTKAYTRTTMTEIKIKNISTTRENVLMPLPSQLTSQSYNHFSDFYDYSFVYSWTSYKWNHTGNTLFYWLLVLKMIISEMYSYCVYQYFFLYNTESYSIVYHNLFIHPPIDRCLVCSSFQLLWIKLHWISLYKSLWVKAFLSLRYKHEWNYGLTG